MSDTPLLKVEGLVKEYTLSHSAFRQERVRAVDGVSFSVERGETLALVGESGCGKSTIGKCVLRLIDPTAGTIAFKGQPVQALPPSKFRPLRASMQMVFQNPIRSFNPMLTLRKSLLDFLQLRQGLTAAQREAEVVRLLERVQLPPDFASRSPDQVSGGQLQRVGVARALAPGPELIFLDEPTSALDVSIRGQIVNLLLDLQQEDGLAYVLVSHDMRVVQAMAHRVLVLYLGQVVEEADARTLFANPMHPYTRGLLAATLIGDTALRGQRERIQLRGEVHSAVSAGCRLAPRCPFAEERCRREEQVFTQVGAGHQVRCWKAVEL